MTVRDLREMLEGVDETLEVRVYHPSEEGGIVTKWACKDQSGYTKFPAIVEENGEFSGEMECFCLFPCGLGWVSEEEGDDDQD